MGRAWVVVFTIIAAGCGTSSGGEPIALQVTLPASSVRVSQPVIATAVGLDRDGAPVALSSVTWSTSRADLATVDAHGNVTPIAAGDVEIQASSEGLTAGAPLHVTAAPS